MATYTGIAQAKPSISKIWLAVVALAVAAALAITLAMTQRPSGTGQQTPLNDGPKSGEPHFVNHSGGFVYRF